MSVNAEPGVRGAVGSASTPSRGAAQGAEAAPAPGAARDSDAATPEPVTEPWRCPSCRGVLSYAARAHGASGTQVGGTHPDSIDGPPAHCPVCQVSYPAEAGHRRFAPNFQPEGFPRERQQHLAEIAQDHFWFPARERLLARLLDRHRRRNGVALEIGCGPGRFLPSLAQRFSQVLAVDAYDASLGDAAARLDPEPRRRTHLAQADVRRLPVASDACDWVVALDVLEHLDDDRAALAELHRVTRPGGRLLVSVPAFPHLWSAQDEAAGHRRRYRVSTLGAALAAAGWQWCHHTHYQATLFPLLWASRRLASGLDGVERRPPAWLGHLLGAVNRAEVAAFSGLSLPWGSSLMAVAQRPA